MKKYEYYKIRNGKIHVIPLNNKGERYGDRYLCGLIWEYSFDTEIKKPKSLGSQLCKKCAKKMPGGKVMKAILPDKLFEI